MFQFYFKNHPQRYEDGSRRQALTRVLKDKRQVVTKIFRALKLDKTRYQSQLAR